MNEAMNVIYAMFGANGIILQESYFAVKGGLPQLLLPVENPPGFFFQLAFFLSVLIVSFSPSSNNLVKKFKPSVLWMFFIGIGFFLSFLAMTKPTEFLYFQF